MFLKVNFTDQIIFKKYVKYNDVFNFNLTIGLHIFRMKVYSTEEQEKCSTF